MMEGSTLTCLQQLSCLPAAALALSILLTVPAGLQEKNVGKEMVQGMELGAFIEELLHAACAVSVSEMKCKRLVREKSAPVVDPDTGNLSVLSQMEAADENWSF